MLKGVDVSKWQGVINWDALAPAVDFAFMRMSVGCPDPGQSDDLYVDAQFVRNYNEATARNELVGVYHYCYPQYNEPENEARFVARSARRFLNKPTVIALDYEESSSKNPVDWANRFFDTLNAELGYRAMLYINKSLNDQYDWSPVVADNNGLWLARWDYKETITENTDWPFVAVKQYSNKENIGGISPVDADLFNGTAEQFLKYCFDQTPVTPPVVEDPKDVRISQLEAALTTCENRPPEIKEVIKEVPVEKIVEKEVKVEVPVEKIVDKIVEVPAKYTASGAISFLIGYLFGKNKK